MSCFVRSFRTTITLAVVWAILGSAISYGQSNLVTRNARTVTQTVPVFKDGEAQKVDGFSDPRQWVRHDLWVETDADTDGNNRKDRVHVEVTRQFQTETEGLKVPVVYITSPYFKGMGTNDKTFLWNPQQELNQPPPKRIIGPPVKFQGLEKRDQRIASNRPFVLEWYIRGWLPRGYAVVYSSSPGSGLSEGCPSCGGDNESQAPKAVIDWLCGRRKGFTSRTGQQEVEASWCSGKVGMTGGSYNGTLAVAAATTGVEGLEAIVPISANLSYYHYYRSNGLVRHPGGYIGEDIDVLYDFVHSGIPEFRDHCNRTVRDELMLGNLDRTNGDYNEFWAQRDYINDLTPSYKAATFFVHGLNDWNVMPSHSIRFYQALKKQGVPCQILLHQGGHDRRPPFNQMNRWFTHFLHGVENGVEDGPKAWVERAPENRQLDRRGLVKREPPVAYEDYPNPKARAIKFFLGKGGNARGTLTINPAKNQGAETLVDNAAIEGMSLATLQRSENRLLYLTKRLAKPLHISGTAKIRLRLACDRPAANLSVWLVSLPWSANGKIGDNLITRGWADPQNRNSLTKGEPLVPGEYYDVEFELEPDDQMISTGQQVGLMVFSSDRDFTLWPKPGTKLTVDLDQSWLELPIVQ